MSSNVSFLPNARRRMSVALAALAAVVVPLALGATASGQIERGPEWSQFQGGPEHHGGSSDGPAPPYRTRWTFSAPEGSGLSGVVIVDGLAISVGRQAVYALELATGETAWDVVRSDGPISAPAVAPGRPRTLLFVDGGAAAPSPSPSPGDRSPTDTPSPSDASPSPSPDDDDSTGGASLVSIGLTDREEVWRVALDAPSRSGITVDGDAAYVGDDDGTLYAVDVADGTVRWTADLPGRIDISIAASGGVVVATSRSDADRRIVVAAHDADDGERLWQVAPRVASTAASSSAFAEDVVIFGLSDRFVRAVGAADGDERWSSLALQLFSPETSPAVHEGSVFVADLGGGLYRLDAASGERVWSFHLNEVVLRSAPVVVDRWVLIGLEDGRLVAIDFASGRLNWESAPSRGAVGAVAVASDAVVAVKGGDEPSLVAFESDPDGRLIDVPSPSKLDPGTTLARIALAGAIVFAASLVPAVLIRRRSAGAPVDPDVDDADEPADEP